MIIVDDVDLPAFNGHDAGTNGNVKLTPRLRFDPNVVTLSASRSPSAFFFSKTLCYLPS